MNVLVSSSATPMYAAAALVVAGILAAGVVLLPSQRLSLARRRPGIAQDEGMLGRVSAASTAVVAKAMARDGRDRRLSRALDRAGLRVDVADFVLLVGCSALAAGAVGLLLAGPLAGALLSGFTVAGSYAFVLLRADRRKAEFGEQLEDILQLLASNMRAGYSLQQGLDSVGREVDEPARSEVARVVNQVRVGRDLGVALDETADRMGSDDFRWVAQAIAIHRQVGGNLADVLDTVGETIRERAQVRRQVKALSAEGRFSALILLALPFVVALALAFLNPDYIGLLFSHVIGYIMVAVAMVMIVIGALWLRKVVTVEF
jgi:tight adherence protein B